MNVQVRPLDQLGGAELAPLRQLLLRAEGADHHVALSDSLRDGSPGGVVVVLVRGERRLVGAATLTPVADGMTALHVVVDPAHRGPAEDVRRGLIGRALDEATGPVRLWIYRASDGDDGVAAGFGLRPERDLLQMRVAIPLPEPVLAGTRAVETRPFDVARDEEAWLAVNNRAFAGHPEQGNWTMETLHGHEKADWFDPDGFLVVPEPDGSGLIGSCWTKIHRGWEPELGEIYVISVDPSHHGEGWGRALTVAGLQWLAGQDLTVGMLYTGADNVAAVGLYTSLGFTVDHIDRSYVS